MYCIGDTIKEVATSKKIDTLFFKKWTKEMAYVLGFFAADGTMVETKRGGYYIEFHITDLDLIREIRSLLGSEHKIMKVPYRGSGKLEYRLQIGNKEMYEDLVVLGMTSRKSKTLKFPEVPDIFLPDFIRGYFDGDGCVSCTKIFRKDRGYWDWSFSTRFTSGSKSFLETLHNILKQYRIQGGYIYQKSRGYELVFSRNDSLALFSLIYNNEPCSVFLKRKKRIFEKAFKVLKYNYMRV